MKRLVFVFDLDMTLVDTSALTVAMGQRDWGTVRSLMGSAKAFSTPEPRPHEVPALLKNQGHHVAIVTSSPRWYAESLLAQFGVSHDTLVAHEDAVTVKPSPAPVTEALGRVGGDPRHAYVIGDSGHDFEAAAGAGVHSIGAAWGIGDSVRMGTCAPDSLLHTPEQLLVLDQVGPPGYFAEVALAGSRIQATWDSYLPCGNAPTTYALGRYYPSSRDSIRHTKSSLSRGLINLKYHGGPATPFISAVDAFLEALDWKPHWIVPVPDKRGCTPSGLSRVIDGLQGARHHSSLVLAGGLLCREAVPEYKSLGADRRHEAIRGTISTETRWDGYRVLVVDDIVTSGATVHECARILREHGALDVRAVAIAATQRPLS